MTMHAQTRAAVVAAIAAELAADPTARGYAGQTAAQIAALMAAPIETPAPTRYQDVPVSSVEGYMRLRRHIVRLRRWVATAQEGDLRDFAEELLEMIAAANVQAFQTSDDSKRPAILAAFAGLAAAGAGGFNAQSLADLTAMTVAPAGPPTVAPARWAVIIDGIAGQEGHAGPPNAPDAALIQEALDA